MISYIYRLFVPRKSIDQIIGPLDNIATELRNRQFDNAAKVSDNIAEIDRLGEENMYLRQESERASALEGKLEELL